jgi:hypothetical protein
MKGDVYNITVVVFVFLVMAFDYLAYCCSFLIFLQTGYFFLTYGLKSSELTLRSLFLSSFSLSSV